ncbi:MAG: hypothetical protein MUC34_01435 [Anaerolineae bacterium]|jgi:hypothetical protein|nr:hypothetical protein [Anaerolineae bacterium]
MKDHAQRYDIWEWNTLSFVVRIWLEEPGGSAWRGHITHVESGTRRYVDDFSQLNDFIAGYLREKGVDR